MNMDESMVKAIPESTATYKGHMNRHKSGLRSTKNQRQAIPDARKELQNMHPTDHLAATQEKPATMFCFTATQEETSAALADDNEGTICTDLTGRFPVRLCAGNQHIFCCYSCEANAILVRPTKDREAQSHIDTHKDIYDCLTA